MTGINLLFSVFFHPLYFISYHFPSALLGFTSSLSVPLGPDVWGYEAISDPRPRALSVLAVRPELDTLYRQMSEQRRGEGPERAHNSSPFLSFHCFKSALSPSASVLTGLAVPQEKTLFSFSPSPHNLHDLTSYAHLSHHAFPQYQLGGIPEDHSVKSDSGQRPLWDAENFVGSYAGYPAENSQAGLILQKLRGVLPLFFCCYNIIVLFICRCEFDRGASTGGQVSATASGGVHQDQ